MGPYHQEKLTKFREVQNFYQDCKGCGKKLYLRREKNEKLKALCSTKKDYKRNWQGIRASLPMDGGRKRNNNYYPRRMIFELAQEAPEVVREMFKELFKDGKDVVEQILVFLNKSDDLLAKYGKGKGA